MKTFTILACSLLLNIVWGTAVRAQDQIDLSTAAIFSSPTDIASWPADVHIDQITMQPNGTPAPGLSFQFSGTDWPDYTPPGWAGPIQYTVWACAQTPRWVCAGFVQMWRGRPNTGAPMLTDFHKNWAYSDRWGSLNGYLPQAGDTMAFFLSAGNARDTGTVTSVRSRSNVVAVRLPINDMGAFTFPNVPAPAPPPVVVPPVVDNPVPPAVNPPPVVDIPPAPVPDPLPTTPLPPVVPPVVTPSGHAVWKTLLEAIVGALIGILGLGFAR